MENRCGRIDGTERKYPGRGGDRNHVYVDSFDEGWSVGWTAKKAEGGKIADAFIGIELTEGEHYIEMHYRPKGVCFRAPSHRNIRGAALGDVQERAACFA